ncbi:MAG: hypothetical protein H6747_02920 [Deltaproteobacteria bacterium]|nr:hypothetical protein [Deltaproteobacteria bacterium]
MRRPVATLRLFSARRVANGLVAAIAGALLVGLLGGCGPSQEGNTPGPSGSGGSADGGQQSDGTGLGKDSSGPAPSCGTDADCAFRLALEPCERAVCIAQRCKAKPRLDGEDCDDGDPCSTVSRCLGGSCFAEVTKPCDDGNPCTVDGCDSESGACTALPVEGRCDGVGACALGVCGGGICSAADAYAVVDLPVAATHVVRAVAVGGTRVLAIETAAGSPFVPRPFASSVLLFDRGGAEVATLAAPSTRTEAAIALAGGDFVVVGSTPQSVTQTAEDGLTDASLQRIDSAGAVVWSVRYGTPHRDVLAAVSQRADGAIVAVGARHIGLPGEKTVAEGWLLVCAPSGALTLDYHYASPQPLLLAGVATSGDQALLAGWQTLAGAAGAADKHAGLLLRVAPGGPIEKVRQLALGTAAVAIARDPSTGQVIAALRPDGGAAPSIWIGDPNLEPVTTVALQSHEIAAAGIGLGALIPGGGAVRLLAERSGGRTWLARIHPSGALHWHRDLAPLGGVAVGADDAGALWLAGPATATAAQSPGQRLCRVDGFGYDGCGAAGPCAGKGVLACDDGVACTLDRCDAAQGCGHTAVTTGCP